MAAIKTQVKSIQLRLFYNYCDRGRSEQEFVDDPQFRLTVTRDCQTRFRFRTEMFGLDFEKWIQETKVGASVRAAAEFQGQPGAWPDASFCQGLGRQVETFY